MLAWIFAGNSMKRSAILGIIVAALAASNCLAADVSLWRGRPQSAEPVYVLRVPPRSPQAQTVWNSDACWRGCDRQCGWRFQACLPAEGQGECTAQTDACDRSCQSHCGGYGGPLFSLAD